MKDYLYTLVRKIFKGLYIGKFTLLNKTSILHKPYKIGSFTYFKNSEIGRFSYIGNHCMLNHTKIGMYCSLGDDIKIISGRHPLNFVSTSPYFYSTRKQCGKTLVYRDLFDEYEFVNEDKTVVIGNDVWIGNNTLIMAGISIGNGAVIGAGSLVTKNVDSYEVVGGVPAKVIKKRFSEKDIEVLEKSKWWDWNDKEIETIKDKMLDIEKFLEYIKVRSSN